MSTESNSSLRDILNNLTAPAAPALYTKRSDHSVQCHACAHECNIPEGRSGLCQVRINRDGTVYAPHGYIEGMAVDPIEKKPFYHVLPGSTALSFGMLGCNLRCQFCQNWYTAQALREGESLATIQPLSAAKIVNQANSHNCRSLISTYNEPLITADWAARIFERARPQKLLCGFVSNGFATAQALRFLRDYAQLFKIDLKTFDDANYRALGGRLQPVLDSIVLARDLGFWVEIVTLVVPQFNDSPAELRQIAAFLASVSPDIPWHVTAFRPQYKMQDRGRTPAAIRQRAYEIGKEEGLNFVYAGNSPRALYGTENTACPGCKELLVERTGFTVQKNRVTNEGRCPTCRHTIPGIWS